MEYAQTIWTQKNTVQQSTNVCGELCNNNYYKYVGWQDSNESIKKYFSPDTVKLISRKVTELLQGVDPKNRPIIVPNKSICNIMSSVFDNFRPQTGDIYSRYIIPSQKQQNCVQNMIDQVIEIIVTEVKTELGFQQCNAKLTAWVQVYGNFNKWGLQQTPKIKTQEKRPNPMEFNMNY